MEERPKPEIESDEALLKMEAAAVCRTDLRILEHGHHRLKGEKKVLGHEFTGKLVDVGDQVTSFSEGQDVVVAPVIGCGECDQCLQGYPQRCPQPNIFGIGIDGGFQEYVRIPSDAIKGGNILPRPKEISYKEAALTEPLATCLNAQLACDIEVADTVMVIGAGPMGILHTILAQYAGANKIIVSEVLDDRRKRSEKFGADVTVNPMEEDLEEAVMEETKDRGAEVVLVTAPVPIAQKQAVKCATMAGKINLFATLPENKQVDNFPINDIHYKQIYVTGTSGASYKHLERMLGAMASGNIELGGVISGEYPLTEINEAMEKARDNDTMKVIVTPTDRIE